MSVTGVVYKELSPRPLRNRAKLSTIALCVLSTGALGTSAAVAVAASPACGEFVRTYVDRVERNLVSPTTLRRWREWGVRHPNWHPSLHAARRPKFKKVREEKLSRMQVDCQVLTPEIPLLTAALDTFLFAPAAPAAPDFEQALNAPVAAPIQAFQSPTGGASIASIGAPGGIGGGGGSAPGGGSPITDTPISSTPISNPVAITPIAPATPAPVPEPNSIVLTLTGMAAIAAFSIFRRKQPGYRHSS